MIGFNNLDCAVYFFIILNLVLYYIKPNFLFENDNFKKLGINKGETLIPFWLLTILSTIFIYFLLTIKSSEYIK